MSCCRQLIALVLALTALPLLAQFQVNPMTNTNFNREVYGGGTSGAIRYAGVNPSIASRSSQPMQSEWRQAYYKSGALPSDVRMGYAELGPMVEGGPISYINAKPSYLASNKPPPPPPVGQSAFSTMGTVRYASPNAAPNPMLAPTALSASSVQALQQPARSATSFAPGLAVAGNSGAIRYSQ